MESNLYFSPSEALKGRDYKCNDCGSRVILRKGEVRKPHFAHYAATSTCSYYDHPSESQIHKDAKELMKKLLTDKAKLQFVWKCDDPTCGSYCNSFCFREYQTIKYKEGDEVALEYHSPDNKWIADVAVVNDGKVRYIIEIKATHGTDLGRPEPWFEVDASAFIKSINHQQENNGADLYTIFCVRQNIKRYCYGSFCKNEEWNLHIPVELDACIICGLHDYPKLNGGSPGTFQVGAIGVCIDCLFKDTYEKRIPAAYKPRCYGACFIYGDDGYIMSRRRYCTQDCKLIKCLKCPGLFPQILLDCRGGSCPSHEDTLAKYFFVYLNVPFAKKEEAKSLGAKWDGERKKWYMEKDSKRLAEALSKFK